MAFWSFEGMKQILLTIIEIFLFLKGIKRLVTYWVCFVIQRVEWYITDRAL